MRNLLLSALLLGNLSSAFAGGVSGGGGNSKPVNPVSREEVGWEISTARNYALFYLNYLTVMHPEGRRSDVDTKIFSGATTIMDKVRSLPIRVAQNGPCLDPAGNEMDGSAFASAPQSVCLSVPRLAEKLSRDNARPQIIALIVHEYSHLLGATEDEADQLQVRALNDLRYADYLNIDKDHSAALDATAFISELYRANWGSSETDEERQQIKRILRGFRETFSERVNRAPFRAGFIAFDSATREFIRSVADQRMLLLSLSGCALAGGEEAKPCKKFLNKAFRGDREISYRTYRERMGDRPEDIRDFPGVKFLNVRNYQQLPVEALRAADEARFLQQLLELARQPIDGSF